MSMSKLSGQKLGMDTTSLAKRKRPFLILIRKSIKNNYLLNSGQMK
jgi:hypothetical protein